MDGFLYIKGIFHSSIQESPRITEIYQKTTPKLRKVLTSHRAISSRVSTQNGIYSMYKYYPKKISMGRRYNSILFFFSNSYAIKLSLVYCHGSKQGSLDSRKQMVVTIIEPEVDSNEIL